MLKHCPWLGGQVWCLRFSLVCQRWGLHLSHGLDGFLSLGHRWLGYIWSRRKWTVASYNGFVYHEGGQGDHIPKCTLHCDPGSMESSWDKIQAYVLLFTSISQGSRRWVIGSFHLALSWIKNLANPCNRIPVIWSLKSGVGPKQCHFKHLDLHHLHWSPFKLQRPA